MLLVMPKQESETFILMNLSMPIVVSIILLFRYTKFAFEYNCVIYNKKARLSSGFLEVF